MDPETKQRQLDRLRRVVNAPVTIGSGLAGANLCDMYANLKDRDAFVAVMKDRFPHATGELEDPAAWAGKRAEESYRASYVSNYVGEVGERQAMETLEAQGIPTVQAESRINPDDDLYEVGGSGAWSVKSYQDVEAFHSVVREHPESTGYVVNSELYAALSQDGDIERYASQGVEIRDGIFSHDQNVEMAEGVVSRMDGSLLGESYDGLVDDWPWIASVVVLANASISAKQYATGNRTLDELIADLGTSLARLASTSGGAFAGTALGAAVGTAVFPLVGSVIGGTFGALLGAMGTGEVIRWASLRYRWGDSKRAFDLLAERYREGFSPELEACVAEGVLGRSQIVTTLLAETERLNRFREELDVHSDRSPSVASVLIDETVTRLGRAARAIETASRVVGDGVLDVCIEFGKRRHPREREPMRREARMMYGAFLAECRVLRPGLQVDELDTVRSSDIELSRYPNHPYALGRPKDELLAAIALATLARPGDNHEQDR